MSRSKVGDQVDAAVKSGRGLSHLFALRGLFDVWAYAPLKVSDPQRVLDAVKGLHKDAIAQLHNGVLGLAHWKRAVAADPSLLALDGLFSGGSQMWHDQNYNKCVDVGLTLMLETFFNGSTYTALHYVGLTSGTPTTAITDTMSSHAGWTEVVAYSEATRVTYNPDAAASKSIDNSTTKADFSINGTTTVGGAFLTTDNTKSGTAGTLISVEAFTGGDKSLGSGDTLSVQITYTLADT